MDAPHETAELSLDRVDILNDALHETRTEIREQNFVGEKGAIDLAGKFLSYWYEFHSFLSDNESTFDNRASEIVHHVSSGYLEDPRPNYRNVELRGEIITAIRDAQMGKNSKMIEVLKKEADRWRDRLVIDGHVEQADGFEKLANALPAVSDYKLKIPFPVMMDPKYNPDANPLPLKKDESGD